VALEGEPDLGGAEPVPLTVLAQPATASATSNGAVRTRRTVRAPAPPAEG